MATNTLKARLTLCTKTAEEWKSYEPIPLKGELCVESDTKKAKIGDGVKKFSELTYFNITPENLETAITEASHTHSNKTILDAITAAFTTELKTKLDGIEAGAQKNVKPNWNASAGSAAEILNKPTALPADGGDADTVNGHTVEANVPADAKFTDTTYGAAGAALGLVKTGGDVTITDGVITVNDDSHNHTIANVDGLQSALDGKVPTSRTVNGHALTGNIALDADDVGALAATLKGANNGVAELDATGKVPSNQLPAFVDDVVEGYLSGGKFYKESSHTTAITGEAGKIYVDLTSLKTYRWSGTAFVVISETIALGETSTTAYRGDRGKTAYEHSQSAHAPSNAERNVIIQVKVNGEVVAADGSRAVDISMPTKVSELQNDSGFLTSGGTIENAESATQLATNRTFQISGGATAAAVNFNGTQNVNLQVTSLNAAKLAIGASDTLVLDGNF